MLGAAVLARIKVRHQYDQTLPDRAQKLTAGLIIELLKRSLDQGCGSRSRQAYRLRGIARVWLAVTTGVALPGEVRCPV